MTVIFNRVRVVDKVHVHTKIIKLSAAVHQLSCTQTFMRYLAMVNNPKIRSCDLDL